jgi:hypothetical protein
MRIKPKNAARLASISALGAGALGVTAGTAQAGIVYEATPGTFVGYTGQSSISPQMQFTTKLPGSVNPFFTIWAMSNGTKWSAFIKGAFQLKTVNGFLGLVGTGQTWNTATGAIKPLLFSARIARRTSISSTPGQIISTPNGATYLTGGRTGTHTFSGAGSSGNFSALYALFTFQNSAISPNLLYGWVELSSSVNSESGPLVTVEGWAYDDSGNPIVAGDTGEGTAPEPSTMAMTSLGALALGAIGLRRWRAARKLTA